MTVCVTVADIFLVPNLVYFFCYFMQFVPPPLTLEGFFKCQVMLACPTYVRDADWKPHGSGQG